MDFTRNINDGGISLTVEGAMSICNAAALHAELVSCLKQHESLSIDLSMVSECDASGVQILLAARKSSEAAGSPFRLTRSSASVDDAIVRAGLELAEFQNLDKENSDG